MSMVATLSTTPTSVSVKWTTQMGTVSSIYGRCYILIPANPIGSSGILRFASGATLNFRLNRQANRTLRILDTAGATLWTSTATLTTGTWYRIEWYVTFSTTTGSIDFYLYSGDSSSVLDQANLTSQNFGASSSDTCQFGFPTPQATDDNASIYFDDCGLSASGFLGPSVRTHVRDMLVRQAVTRSAVM
jgi:hypothetical protein